MEKTKKKSLYTKDVILVMAASFFFLFTNMFMNTIINGYAKSLGASTTFAGFIVSTMSITSMLLRPIAGNLSDKFSKYALSLLGGCLILTGITGYIFTPNAQMLMLFRLLNGAGYVLCTVCMTTWLAHLVPREHIGQAMGFYGLTNALAMAVGPAISINLYKRLGYHATIAIAVAAAILIILMVVSVSDHAVPVKSKHAQALVATGNKPRFKLIQMNALPVMLLTTLFAMPYFATQADLVEYVHLRHMDVTVGAYFFIYAIFLLLLRIFLKEYFDTIAFGPWLIASTIATAFYLLMLTIMKNNLMMGLAAIGMAVGYGVIYSVLQSTALLLAPVEEQGIASSTFYLGADIGMALGPIVGGFVTHNLGAAAFYPSMMIIIPLIIIIYLTFRKRLNNAINNH
ncbi:multidrug transport protein [Ligilactobacillus hayakitensis DSM 18933 = JCM 14209]|uniref:Multidrug transport protein n=1 Tax=Ligilactobacillus hayakitensis DSM 18933 = JCM 14209 TaxID=1423755 RepID=A0A0R1WZK2_9LACO|nr:MFS transporter [Ligilactobacillus hayakitensis]KRM20163.1 multidrug transport protein [Ligilactobacillus hayakitensis DSM 18933 = JCM 14209]